MPSSSKGPASMDNMAADLIKVSMAMPQLLYAQAPDYILDSKMNLSGQMTLAEIGRDLASLDGIGGWGVWRI